MPSTSKLHFCPALALTTDDLNLLVVSSKYSVRGRIPAMADTLRKKIEANPFDHNLPYDRITYANIGNPQQLDQEPLTWYRQVLCLLEYPDILRSIGDSLSNPFPPDVIARAELILKNAGSIGAYSDSQGIAYVRKSIANFISSRDGFVSSLNDIFLTSGASNAVSYLLQVLTEDSNSGFLIPIPQYPLYTASITLNNAVPVGYYLSEENNWSISVNQILELVKDNISKNIKIKALVIINPGNPTGSIMTEHDIIEVIKIAAQFGIVIIADEVYQDNVFEGEFISIKKVLSKLLKLFPHSYKDVQLASLHSTSKGFSGECGHRGGYMELFGFSDSVKDTFLKMASINLCPAVPGQAIMELMVNPPKLGEYSYELYKQEKSSIHLKLKKRADTLHAAFEEMEDISCNKPMGAMYLFPKLNFSAELYPKLYAQSEEKGILIDEFYCIHLLENAGICCVPGNGFGQVRGTYHLRTTFLPPGEEWIQKWKNIHARFIKQFKSRL